MLSNEELTRYTRTIILPSIGEKGQYALKKARVLVIGTGGLGSPSIWHLASIGVGTIGIVDYDVVDISNLQRQTIHTTDDIGKAKTTSAQEKIQKLNPHVCVVPYQEKFNAENAEHIIPNYDFVLDCTDNFETKLCINEMCVKHNKPFSHAGVLEFYGQVMTIIPHTTACYRCAFPHIPASFPTLTRGVFNIAPGIIGTLQANEAVKYILNIGELLTNRLLTFDSLEVYARIIPIQKKVECPVCGKGKNYARHST